MTSKDIFLCSYHGNVLRHAGESVPAQEWSDRLEDQSEALQEVLVTMLDHQLIELAEEITYRSAELAEGSITIDDLFGTHAKFLWELMQEQGMLDHQERRDFVFNKLNKEHIKTCCMPSRSVSDNNLFEFVPVTRRFALAWRTDATDAS